MKKEEYLSALEKRLSGLPAKERKERLRFFGEMIDDRIEDGCSEEDAVQELGSVEELAEQIIGEISLPAIAGHRMREKRALSGWEIALLIVGAPLWLPLLVAAVAVALSLYAVLWALLLSLWAVVLFMAASFVAAVGSGIALAVRGDIPAGLALLGAGLFCAGLSILLFLASLGATKGVLKLTKKMIFGIKKSLLKKEERA